MMLLALVAALVQSAIISVPTDKDFSVEGRFLPLNACSDGPSGFAYLQVSGETLRFPAGSVVSFTPKAIRATGDVRQPDVMQLEIPASAGCRETPLDAAYVQLDPHDPALPNGIMVGAVRPGATGVQMEQLLNSGRCGVVNENFVGCSGEINGARVTALISRTLKASAGGALFAMCEEIEGQTLCEVQGGRSFTYKGVLAPGLPTPEALAAADAAADAMFRPGA